MAPIFMPWCASGSPHGRLVRKWVVPDTPAGIQNPHLREHLASTSMLTSLKAPVAVYRRNVEPISAELAAQGARFPLPQGEG